MLWLKDNKSWFLNKPHCLGLTKIMWWTVTLRCRIAEWRCLSGVLLPQPALSVKSRNVSPLTPPRNFMICSAVFTARGDKVTLLNWIVSLHQLLLAQNNMVHSIHSRNTLSGTLSCQFHRRKKKIRGMLKTHTSMRAHTHIFQACLSVGLSYIMCEVCWKIRWVSP